MIEHGLMVMALVVFVVANTAADLAHYRAINYRVNIVAYALGPIAITVGILLLLAFSSGFQ